MASPWAITPMAGVSWVITTRLDCGLAVGQPVRVTNRDADHAGTCGRKVGVPKVGVPFRKNLLILRMILV